MAGKGLPKTPTKILEMRGSPYAKRRMEEPEPTVGTPECPSWLDKEAKAEWRRVVPEMGTIGLLTVVDRAGLATLCQAWSDYHAAFCAVKKEGKTFTTPQGYIAKNPMVTIMNEAFERWRKMAQQFGLTPSARAGLAKPKDNPDENRGRSKERFFKNG